ncbi:hypothetical protein SmJEL517_g03069 [Synchytrium microbalum]|uniref:Uncharacterized protein n=1 Tax=Synchytrium microbalum TaxID=1806994 RepID=A0A507C3J5_9FUNG|nr:uncharacterized protein SmJEL517_g03069 [Synchytrium microbalum]TPX34242.1 hypothetical protein SmJEL517_g03069 [Synchytrium microbalum]
MSQLAPAYRAQLASQSSTSEQQKSQKQLQPAVPSYVHFLAGGIGGTVGAAVTCPLEVVKTRLQSSLYHSPQDQIQHRNPLRAVWGHVRGVVSILVQIQQKEGVRALFKGLGPNLIGVVPARAIYFGVYNHGKAFYTQLNKGHETSIVHMSSAITAGTVVATVTSPIWLVKTRMQLQSEVGHLEGGPRYRNSFHCFYVVVRNEGIRGLYKGLTASYLGLAESTLQFVTYEYLKKAIVERRSRQRELLDAQNSNFINRTGSSQRTPMEWLDTFLVAAGAKLMAAIVTYPHEVLRTRMRQNPDSNGISKYRGIISSTKLIYQEEGILAFYGGMTAHLMRVVPNAAILFLCYEVVVSLASSSTDSLPTTSSSAIKSKSSS